MKSHHFLILVALLCLLIAPAAADVSDSTVVNTNVYAGSDVYDIAPPANVTTSTASGITNVAGRYLYAAALENSVSEKTATLYLVGQQGATINITDNSIVSGLSIDYGDGTTGSSLTHEYAADGIYNITVTATNYLDQTGITLTDRVQIGETSISITVSPNTLTTGQSWTLTANAVIADSIQWQVSRNNASWTNIPAGTYTPSEYGTYYFRAIAYGADRAAYSNVEQTTYQYAVSDSTVTNTNVYATSNVFDIAPSGYYDAASTASGITNVAGRYLYASALEVIENGRTAIYNIIGLQGSTTTLTDGRITQGYLWDHGDGTNSTTTQLSHTYGAPGRYVTTLGLTNYLDSTGVSLTGNAMYVGPIVGALTADKTAGALGETFNITANVTNYTSIDWYLARYSDGQWYVITDAHGTTLSYAPNQYGDWYFRAKATNSQTGFSQYTDTIKITVYRPPTILNTAINPANGPLTNTITLSATVETPGGTPQLQWQKSSDGTTWTNIEGATTSTWVGSQTFSSGKHYYRLTATGAGGTSYGPAVTYTAYGAPVFSSVQASSSIVALPGSVTLTASASDTNTYTWQELKSGNWVNVGNGKELYLKLSSAGIHTYRAVAVGFGGTTTSQTISVDAGYAPNIKIISPKPGEDINLGSNVTITADVIGAVNTTWNFGDTTHEVISQTTNTATVLYKNYGYKTITLSGTNKYGSGSSTITIIVVSGWERPMATTPINPVDTTPVKNFTDSFNVPQGEILDLPAVFGALTAPMSDLLPDGMFMVIVFGVIFIMLWIMTKNTAVPSIIGLIFGGFILALLPASYNGAAVVILAISIVGGVIRVFIPPK